MALLDQFQAVALQPHDGALGVGQQHHLGDPEVEQDLRADAVVAQLGRRPLGASHPAHPVGQAGGAGLTQQHHDAPALGGDHRHRRVQPVGPVVGHDVHQQVNRVHPHRHRTRGRDVAPHQHQVFCVFDRVGVDDRPPVAADGAHRGTLLDAADQLLGAPAVADQVGDGPELQAVVLRERHQLRQPGHGAVVAHHLADDAGRVQPGQPRDVDGRLGVAGADQAAALARHQREHVARRHDVRRPAGRVDGDRHAAGAVVRRDAGGDAVRRLDRDGERGLVAAAVGAAHQRQAQVFDAVAGHRQADQPARVLGHEVDRVRGRELRRDDEVALVLAVLVVDQDEHAPLPRLLDQLLGRAEVVGQAPGQQVVHQRCSTSRAT